MMQILCLRRTRLTLLGAVAVLATNLSTIAYAQSTIEEIRERGTIRLVGVNFPPYIIAGPDGSYSGIDYDLVNMYAESIGVEVEIVPGTWGTAIAGIQSGKWDVAPVMCWKPERAEVVTFLETHYSGGLVAAVLKDEGPFNLEELNNEAITFVYPAGTFKETFADSFFPEATKRKLTNVSGAQAVLEMLSGRADATLLDAPIDITKVENAFPDRFEFVPSKAETLPDTACLGSLVVKRDAYEFAAGLNDFIKLQKSEGGITELYELHFEAIEEGKL